MSAIERPDAERTDAADTSAMSALPTDGLALEAMLAAVALGDHASFGAVYDAISGEVFGLARRVLGDADMAAEVTQDVLVEVWRNAPTFESARGSARAWILTIAHRHAIDRVRGEQRARRRDARLKLPEAAASVDPQNDGLDATLHGAPVPSSLELLSPLQREAITLAYFDGLTYPDVAAHLGVPLSTIKARIRDGLLHLRDHLADGPLHTTDGGDRVGTK